MQNQEKKETQSINSVSVKVYYAKGISVSITNKTFPEAMILIWKSPAFSDYEPLKIVFTSTGKTLYAEKAYFNSYLDGNINMQELMELTQCDELYRNTKELLTDDNITVDQGSLWKANDKELTLIDNDNHITAKMNKLLFEIAI